MPYQAELHYDLPIWDETDTGKTLRVVRQGKLENPYPNYLALLSQLYSLATDAPVSELLRFADCGEQRVESPGSPWSRYSLLLLQWTAGPEKPGWYDFESEAFSDLLQQPLLQPCFDGEAYRNLDYYLTALVELRLLRELPELRPVIQRLWIYQELLDFYWHTFPLRQVLAASYELMGWRWLCLDAETQPLHYRGGLLGALSLLAADPSQAERVRVDLVSLHDHLILTAGAQLNEPLVSELRASLQDAIAELGQEPA